MHGRLFSGLVILISAAAMGCGAGNSGKVHLSSGSSSASSGSGTTVPVAAGELAVSPKVLSFGKVAVGTSKSQSGTLTSGDASITVRSADWSGPGYSVSGIVFPTTIPAGQSVHFKVTFAPQSSGSASGSIKFVSNADNAPQAAFNGNGTQTATTHGVTLAWHPPASTVAGYNVYRGVAPKGPYSKITGIPHPTPTFTDASVEGGTTYFYMTTAVSKKGKESKYSNQVQVTIPNS
jgi:Abnormal spindle-like microcephaly-assoc'd, ASPM-SPD-2-Hydin